MKWLHWQCNRSDRWDREVNVYRELGRIDSLPGETVGDDRGRCQYCHLHALVDAEARSIGPRCVVGLPVHGCIGHRSSLSMSERSVAWCKIKLRAKTSIRSESSLCGKVFRSIRSELPAIVSIHAWSRIDGMLRMRTVQANPGLRAATVGCCHGMKVSMEIPIVQNTKIANERTERLGSRR